MNMSSSGITLHFFSQIRKELFSPREAVTSPLALNLIFSQVIKSLVDHN